MSAPPPLQPTSVVSSSSMPPSPPQQNWMQRHWKGLVVAIVGLVVVSCLALALSIVGLVMWSIRQSDVYRMAMTKARQNPEVVRRLGTPIESGWWASGSMSVEGDSGSADFTIPLHGPTQKATMYLDARKRMGEWTFRVLTVKTDHGERIEVVPQTLE